ncbi:hypothetical protein F443_15114 [Phytophthora nicotianae P1569]|uniref:Uncharacterized protein n=4 Tax=Phytophthora nicotianae TaxID=4792 RepID=V9EJ84_PHYNI|nr:hypothetical protein F443_15114 [Phytophthora nicotianae P1569]
MVVATCYPVNDDRGLCRCVTRNLTRHGAITLALVVRIEDFAASTGWLDGFLLPHNLVIQNEK